MCPMAGMTLHLIPRPLQSSPSAGPTQPRTPSLHLLLFREELWRSGSQTSVRVATSYLFPWWPQDPWGEVYILQSSMRCPPRATWGIAGGWLAGGSPLWYSVSKPKRTKFLPLKSNGLLTCRPPQRAPSALQTGGGELRTLSRLRVLVISSGSSSGVSSSSGSASASLERF